MTVNVCTREIYAQQKPSPVTRDLTPNYTVIKRFPGQQRVDWAVKVFIFLIIFSFFKRLPLLTAAELILMERIKLLLSG